jgi:hypothetical protein
MSEGAATSRPESGTRLKDEAPLDYAKEAARHVLVDLLVGAGAMS